MIYSPKSYPTLSLVADYVNRISASQTLTRESVNKLTAFFAGLDSLNLLNWLGDIYFLNDLYNYIQPNSRLISLRNNLATINNNPTFNSSGVTFNSASSQSIVTDNSYPRLGSLSRSIICVIDDSLATSSSLATIWAYGADSVGGGMYLWREGGANSMLWDYGNGTNLGYYVRRQKWYINAFQYSQIGTLSTGWINGIQVLSKSNSINTGSSKALSMGNYIGTSRYISAKINLIMWFNRDLSSNEHIFISELLKNTVASNLNLIF